MNADDPDWKAVAVQLAAIDHRACTIVEAADALAEAVGSFMRTENDASWIGLKAALDAFKVVRQGT